MYVYVYINPFRCRFGKSRERRIQGTNHLLSIALAAALRRNGTHRRDAPSGAVRAGLVDVYRCWIPGCSRDPLQPFCSTISNWIQCPALSLGCNRQSANISNMVKHTSCCCLFHSTDGALY